MISSQGRKLITQVMRLGFASCEVICTPFCMSRSTSAGESFARSWVVNFFTALLLIGTGSRNVPWTFLPACTVTSLMFPRSSCSRYWSKRISGADSARAPDSCISATGINRRRIQNERFLESRPQLVGPLSFLSFLSLLCGGIGPGIYSRLAMYGRCRKLSA